MCTALAANDDTAMIEVLQIACSEMPEVIKTMQCALEDVVEDGRLEAGVAIVSRTPRRRGGAAAAS